MTMELVPMVQMAMELVPMVLMAMELMFEEVELTS